MFEGMLGTSCEGAITSQLTGTYETCIEQFHEVFRFVLILHRRLPGNVGMRIRDDGRIASDHVRGEI